MAHFGAPRYRETRDLPPPDTFQTVSPRNPVNRDLLAYLLVLRSRLWVQPQGDVLGLHGVPGHPYEVLAQRIQVRLLLQSAGKSG